MCEFFFIIYNGGVSVVFGEYYYKIVNIDIVVWICEVCCGIDICLLVFDIVDVFVFEYSIFVFIDCSGVFFFGGGFYMMLRDLCCYGRLLGCGG